MTHCDMFEPLPTHCTHDMRMGIATCVPKAMLDHMKRFVVMSQRAGVAMKPKHHMAVELARRVPVSGNPNLYACWQDETLNRLLGDIGRTAHRSVWAVRVLAKFEHAESQRSVRGSKRPRQ